MLMKSPYTDFSSVFFFIRVCINKERERRREGERGREREIEDTHRKEKKQQK